MPPLARADWVGAGGMEGKANHGVVTEERVLVSGAGHCGKTMGMVDHHYKQTLERGGAHLAVCKRGSGTRQEFRLAS